MSFPTATEIRVSQRKFSQRYREIFAKLDLAKFNTRIGFIIYECIGSRLAQSIQDELKTAGYKVSCQFTRRNCFEFSYTRPTLIRVFRYTIGW